MADGSCRLQRLTWIVGTALLLGCVGPTVTYRIRVRDPAAVSVSSPTAEVLPAGTTPGETLLVRGSFASGEASSTSYEAFVGRDPDRRLVLRWGLVRVLDGDRRTLVAPDGLIALSPSELDDTHFLISPADRAAFLDQDRARLHLYAALDSAYSTSEDSSDFIGYHGFLTGGPMGVVNVPVTLDTSWGNVVEIRREERQHRRMAAGAGIVLTTLITGIVGGSFLLADPHDTVGLRGPGEITLAVGLLADLIMAPGLFAQDHDDVIYPR